MFMTNKIEHSDLEGMIINREEQGLVIKNKIKHITYEINELIKDREILCDVLKSNNFEVDNGC